MKTFLSLSLAHETVVEISSVGSTEKICRRLRSDCEKRRN